jgi:1-acyl-sn-glycerol-3-phosphate acyltransferase
MLVAGTAVPVVPCCITGAFAALPPHRHFPRPAKIRLKIGSPITFSDMSNDRPAWQSIAETAEATVGNNCEFANDNPINQTDPTGTSTYSWTIAQAIAKIQAQLIKIIS